MYADTGFETKRVSTLPWRNIYDHERNQQLSSPRYQGTVMTRIVLETSIGKVSASYAGSIYIDLAFGDQPISEVINIYDYKNQRKSIANTPKQISKRVIKWLKEFEPNLEIYSLKIIYSESFVL